MLAGSPAMTSNWCTPCVRVASPWNLSCDGDDPQIDWRRFPLVVLRSVWDYHRKVQRFREWVATFLAHPGQLWNPPAAVLGNINKSYIAVHRVHHGVQSTVLIGHLPTNLMPPPDWDHMQGGPQRLEDSPASWYQPPRSSA
jgi:hypothetical protein